MCTLVAILLLTKHDEERSGSSDSDRNRSHSLEEFFHGPNEVPEDAQQAVLQPLTRKSGFFCHDDTSEDASSTDESPYKANSVAQEQGFSPLSLE